MRSRAGREAWKSPKVAALLLGALCLVVLLVLATLASAGANVDTVAANARSLHWVNSILGSSALFRAANAQAVVFAVDHELGVASDTALEAAVDESKVATDYFVDLSDTPPVDAAFGPDLDAAIDRLLVIGGNVLRDIEQGNVDSAVRQSQQDFESSFHRLEQLLTEEQSRILTAIDDTENAIGEVSSIANIVVTLLIPVSAVAIYSIFTRRQMRERRLAMEYQIEAAQALTRSKDEFIASISHELRTPLTSIYGFSELLLGTGALDPRQTTELIGIINSESGELMRMVEDILTSARLDARALTFDLAPVDIRHELGMVLLPFERAGLQVALACTDATVVADRLRLRQVIRNLVSNAQKHGGPEIAVSTQIRGTDLVIAVVDNGPGVPTEIERRLFQRFIHDGRRAVVTGSIGLGLSIARNLTEAMDGHLRYSRIEGHTVFSMTIPLAAAPTVQHDLDWYEETPVAALDGNVTLGAVS